MASKKAEVAGLGANEKAPRPPPSFKDGNYKINWIAVAVLILPPMLAFGAFLAGVSLVAKTMYALAFFYTFNGLLGITIGYHRLFSHRSFTGHWILQYLVAFAGAGAFQGSIKWWGRNHRIHHRYIDTDKDPYNATRGFWYTHMGWMVMKQDYGILGKVDVSDFKYSKVVQFQHKHFFRIAMLSGIILPTLVCGLGWGDWLGGYFYAGLAKIAMVHHSTFFINSLAHTNFFGAMQNYADTHSSHDSFVCALLTFGEGYHNFHHEFAQDYRNGIKWYHYDPTKWSIRLFELIGLARNLVRTPNDVIERNRNNMTHKRLSKAIEELERRQKELEIEVPEQWTWEEIERRVAADEKLLVIGGYVLDLQKAVPTGPGYTQSGTRIVWYDAHPGGRKLLEMFVGKDATEAFTGGIYKHSLGAENLLQHLRVATLKR